MQEGSGRWHVDCSNCNADDDGESACQDSTFRAGLFAKSPARNSPLEYVAYTASAGEGMHGTLKTQITRHKSLADTIEYRI